MRVYLLPGQALDRRPVEPSAASPAVWALVLVEEWGLVCSRSEEPSAALLAVSVSVLVEE